MRARLVGWGLVLLVLVAPAAPAGAHGDDPRLQVRLDSVEGAPHDLTVQVQSTVSEQMIVSNPAPTPVRVLDPDGHPFVEVSGEGVRADVRNPFFFRTLGPPDAPVAPPADATGGAPQWRLVTTEASWGWFDPRLHPEEVADGTGVVARWAIPMEHEGKTLTAAGSLVREELLGAWEPGPVVAPEGVTVQLLPGARPAVALTRGSAATVTVLDEAGEAVLRLDREGIALDPLSDAALTTSTAPPAAVGVDGLVPAGAGSFHAWLDARVQPGAPPADDPLQIAASTWRIPVLVDGERSEITGQWRWRPSDAASVPADRQLDDGSWLPLAGGLVALALVGAVGLRLAPRRVGGASAPTVRA